MSGRRTCILLLNWNGWEDTVACVNSILESDHKDSRIIIVDNASTDGSVERILEKLSLMAGTDGKTLTVECMSEDDALKRETAPEAFCDITVIRNNSNYGFGGGNNTGLKYILGRGGFDYVWLLNSDTVVDERALCALVDEAEKDEKAAFVGSVIRYYDNPGTIQAIGGGWFFPYIGLAGLYMRNRRVEALKTLRSEDVLKKINYLMGASILIRTDALTDVGLFDEDFFLYAEELDLIHRAKKKGWKIAVAMDSHVFHKDSASTREMKEFYYYYLYKSNIIFIKKNYGWPHVLTALLPSLANILRTTRKAKNIKAALRGISEGVRYVRRDG